MLEGGRSSAEQFYTNLNLIYESMLSSERNGDYVEAENLQRKAMRMRRQWQEDTLAQMASKFEEASLTLQRNYNEDLQDCNNKWTSTLDTFLQNSRQAIEATQKTNAEELQQKRATLNEQLPSKVKESYQLLNLREMEHHMSKQKDFMQAHLIQNKIRDLYAQQLEAWNEDKARKIDQACANLRAKHAKERELFNKRTQTQLQDYNNAWHQEKALLQQRFNNNAKEMKAAHEREVGSFKKEFKTKGGIFSSKYEDSPSD